MNLTDHSDSSLLAPPGLTPCGPGGDFERRAARNVKTKKQANTAAATEAAAGVTRKYKTAAELEAEIDAYFNGVDAANGIATEQGLANYLGVSVHSLRNWYDGERCGDLKEPTQKPMRRWRTGFSS